MVFIPAVQKYCHNRGNSRLCFSNQQNAQSIICKEKLRSSKKAGIHHSPIAGESFLENRNRTVENPSWRHMPCKRRCELVCFFFLDPEMFTGGRCILLLGPEMHIVVQTTRTPIIQEIMKYSAIQREDVYLKRTCCIHYYKKMFKMAPQFA